MSAEQAKQKDFKLKRLWDSESITNETQFIFDFHVVKLVRAKKEAGQFIYVNKP